MLDFQEGEEPIYDAVSPLIKSSLFLLSVCLYFILFGQQSYIIPLSPLNTHSKESNSTTFSQILKQWSVLRAQERVPGSGRHGKLYEPLEATKRS